MFYVRWRRGESRRGKRFDPLREDHPGVHLPCVLCADQVGIAETVALLIVGPLLDDDEAWERYVEDRWFTAGAALVHARCLDEVSDLALEQVVRELVEEAE